MNVTLTGQFTKTTATYAYAYGDETVM